MCGIIGYTGSLDASGKLIKGLKSLEYRGYDSAGIAVYNSELNEVIIAKSKGRVAQLEAKANGISGNTGIGHTRWATHGNVSDTNSHPHKFGNVTLVHNGIIENYESIKNQLGVAGRLKSQTDTEVVAALIDNYYQIGSDPSNAIIKAIKEIKGTFALGILFDDIPNKIYAVRNVSPIVCCKNDDGAYIASDITAIGEYSKEYFVLPELAIAEISRDGFNIYDFNGNQVDIEYIELDWDINSSGKKDFPFYMEKEITEQPAAIQRIINDYVKNDLPCFDINDKLFRDFDSITVIACGTAMHAGLIGKHLIEKLCRIPVNVCVASEYMYSMPIVNDRTLVICVSQSGETIDTLEALKYAQSNGAGSLAIVNVKASSIAMQADNVIYTNAGPEIAVASTKAYTTQVAVFYLIAAKIAYLRGILSKDDVKDFINELKKVPSAVENVIDRREEIHRLSSSLLTAEHTFMIGRGLDYPALLEASLKLKEISYIHSEAFASGELKHGTIALITSKTPVIALITQKALASKQQSNIREVQSRGAMVITIATHGISDNIDFALPTLKDDFNIIPAVVAMQLLAYYVSADKGLDVDKPRNLAKVVTVE
ncbi:glutamine--fructose-6-phosphate transaminase (isomerizing) [uncultured Eubacterium sp.]|uniref:glutamine--fructose-6-phosphate transaminase (isomerizing) n=1 Tax=uncultured Eubacterium sp. TaxID=165185 RepID=UPI0025D3F980|nr:glutamine--fructose-6-phosphate transaminase (isomerizing) [uncultured Eubacterium sp.]